MCGRSRAAHPRCSLSTRHSAMSTRDMNWDVHDANFRIDASHMTADNAARAPAEGPVPLRSPNSVGENYPDPGGGAPLLRPTTMDAEYSPACPLFVLTRFDRRTPVALSVDGGRRMRHLWDRRGWCRPGDITERIRRATRQACRAVGSARCGLAHDTQEFVRTTGVPDSPRWAAEELFLVPVRDLLVCRRATTPWHRHGGADATDSRVAKPSGHVCRGRATDGATHPVGRATELCYRAWHVAALLVWDSGPVWVGVPSVALTVHPEPDHGPARIDRAGLS